MDEINQDLSGFMPILFISEVREIKSILAKQKNNLVNLFF